MMQQQQQRQQQQQHQQRIQQGNNNGGQQHNQIQHIIYNAVNDQPVPDGWQHSVMVTERVALICNMSVVSSMLALT
jgi:hypothetical protein